MSTLFVHGEYVYWATQTSTQSSRVHRAPRSGGAIEEIGVLEWPVPSFAAIGDDVFVGGSQRAAASNQPLATVFHVQAGKLLPHAQVPTRRVATSLVAHDGSLYWFAANADGGAGDIVVTHRGSTKSVMKCGDRAEQSPPLCRLVAGAPPLATQPGELHRVTPTGTQRLAVHCPCQTGPVRVMGDVVLCNVWAEMRSECELDVPSDHDGNATPTPTFVRLDSRESSAATDVGDDLQFADGFYYHHRGGSLMRRASLGGSDELYASNVVVFATDALGVAWVGKDRRLWTAPHR